MPRKKPAVPVAVPTPLPPRGLRVAEAAQYAGTTLSFMRTLISTGEVPAIRLGKRDVILRDDLDAYLDSLRRRSPTLADSFRLNMTDNQQTLWLLSMRAHFLLWPR